VYIPGLWALLRHTNKEMPSLQQLLKRSDNHSESTLESETLLLNRLGWQGKYEDDVPVAAVEKLAVDNSSDGYWFRADPVNLQEDQNYLMMSYPSVFKLDPDESKSLTDSINQHFAEDGWHIEVLDNNRWYLKLDKNPDITTTPVWRVVGRDVFNLMPAADVAVQSPGK
jgi:hypothetical protein